MCATRLATPRLLHWATQGGWPPVDAAMLRCNADDVDDETDGFDRVCTIVNCRDSLQTQLAKDTALWEQHLSWRMRVRSIEAVPSLPPHPVSHGGAHALMQVILARFMHDELEPLQGARPACRLAWLSCASTCMTATPRSLAAVFEPRPITSAHINVHQQR